MKYYISLLVIFSGVFLIVTDTWADGIPPPPEDCMDGTTPESSHCGQYCAPFLCNNNNCSSEGLECREMPLCIRVLTCHSWGHTWTEDSVTGSCETTSCDGTDTCQTLRVCAPPIGEDADIPPDADEVTPDADVQNDAGREDADTGGTQTAQYGCGCRSVHQNDSAIPFSFLLTFLMSSYFVLRKHF